MNNETIKLLAAQIAGAPDEILDLDRGFCESEADLTDVMRKVLAKAEAGMQTVMADDTISYATKFGYLISTSAMAIAHINNILPSEVFVDLARSSMVAERAAMIGAAFESLLGISQEGAPECPDCCRPGRWCNVHEYWECSNPLCDHEGEVEVDG